MSSGASLTEIALLFLKLGVVAFGGPAAHIAMMEDEVVNRRRWLSREHFLDLVGATNLIPGPNSTEMAIHIGYIVRGWPGLLAAGVCFILPAAAITAVFAWIYVQYATLPAVEPFLFGIKPAVIAIILGAVIRLGRAGVTNLSLALLAATILALALTGANEIMLILAGGVIGMLWLRRSGTGKRWRMLIVPVLIFISRGATYASDRIERADVPLTDLALFFLKIGSVLFGSGYVLIAYLEGGLVRDLGWLNPKQLLDAVAVGQITPGPVLSTATFVGYLLHGWSGAAVATVAIFLPSFFFVLALNAFLPRMRQSRWAAAFLDAVNVSAIALMAAVAIELATVTLLDWRSWLIATVSAGFALKFKINSAFLVIGSAIAGWLLR